MSVNDLSLIRDVSDVLKKLISENVSELSQKVTLESPAEIDIQPSSEDKLSLFLYQVTENPFLKNNYQDIQLTPDSKTVNLQYPPIVLDLFYLLTPFFKDKDKEQIVLTKLIRLLYDNSTLSGTALGDNLLENGNREIRVEMNTLSIEQLNHLWGMFPGRAYRIGLSYVVTPLMIPSQREIGQQRVITKQSDYYLFKLNKKKEI